MELRIERDRRLKEVLWRVERSQMQVALDLTPTEPLLPLLTYVQALRDIPQQEGFPNEIEWPSLEGENG